MKILLDTNAYSGLLSGSQVVLDALAKAELVFVSVIVLGELYAGFKGGSKEFENKKLLELFLGKSTVQVINVTEETADIFGTIKNILKNAGTPLPVNDIWIAAHAMEFGANLLSFDKHFRQIPGLRLLGL